MKKRVSFLMIFLLALLLTGCSEKSGGSTQYQVYYISTSGTKLVEESYTPESSTSPRRGDGGASGKNGPSPGGKRPCESPAG